MVRSLVFLAPSESGESAFLAIFGPFWMRLGVRVRVRSWVGSTPDPWIIRPDASLFIVRARSLAHGVHGLVKYVFFNWYMLPRIR